MQLTELSQFGSLAILFGIMSFGEIIAKVSKGKIPSALTTSALFIVGFWTILPLDIVSRAGVSDLIYSLCAMLIITNLATLISRKEMISQWRTVVINLAGLAAICLVTLTLGSALFGWQNAVAATPPLTGGAIATILMSEKAKELGLVTAALVALITMVMQGLVGYPLTSIFLRKEAKRLEGLYSTGALKIESNTAAQATESKKAAGNIFTKYNSPTFIIFKLALLCLLAFWAERGLLSLSGGAVNISRYVWCLVFGFIAHEVGFLERDALAQSKSDGILLSFLLVFLFGGLNVATPELFFPVAGITLSLVLLAAAGMAVVALVMSKVFKKETFNMCYCIILTAFYGFPINVMLTNEAVDNVTQDPSARTAISSQIMPKMLIGGFTSVTVVSVLIAGILVNYL